MALEQLLIKWDPLDIPMSIKATLPLFYTPEYLLEVLNRYEKPYCQELAICNLCNFDLLAKMTPVSNVWW